MSSSRSGIVSVSFADGFTAPNSTSAVAPPPAWPSSHASRIAGTRSAKGSATTLPFESTTTVFGLTSSTASSSASWSAGRSMSSRS